MLAVGQLCRHGPSIALGSLLCLLAGFIALSPEVPIYDETLYQNRLGFFTATLTFPP